MVSKPRVRSSHSSSSELPPKRPSSNDLQNRQHPHTSLPSEVSTGVPQSAQKQGRAAVVDVDWGMYFDQWEAEYLSALETSLNGDFQKRILLGVAQAEARMATVAITEKAALTSLVGAVKTKTDSLITLSGFSMVGLRR